MFERFTDRGRQVIVFAQDEATSFRHSHIGTEHIMLGLLRAEEGLAARVLGSLGITVEGVRAHVVRISGRGDQAPPGQTPFTPRAKKALQDALNEARDLGHDYVSTRHILLGIVRDNEGVAVRILLDFDIDAATIRQTIPGMLPTADSHQLHAGQEAQPAARPTRLFIPHYALTVHDLPKVGASWSETVQFAGSFDGHIVFPETRHLGQFTAEMEAVHEQHDGTLPDGLTMLRTLLLGLQYWYYHGGEDGGGPNMNFVAAIVERIRALVVAGGHLSPSPHTVGGIQDKVMNAYDRLLAGYASWGGYRYHGWGGHDDKANYYGPAVWSARDCDLRLCLELEKEWPGGTHQEFPITRWTRSDLAESEAVQSVDVAVLDLTGFVEGPDAATRFGGRTHEAFFEVKWCVKGWADNSREHKTGLDAIPLDIAKLANNLRTGRCHVAAMVAFDDGGWWRKQQADTAGGWPRGVWNLYVGPHALHSRGLAPNM